jgi:hypothetical protein
LLAVKYPTTPSATSEARTVIPRFILVLAYRRENTASLIRTV